MTTRRQRRIVVVEWIDAHDTSAMQGADEAEEYHEPKIVHSAGWLLKHDKIGITLCRCYDSDDDVDARLFIPAGMVRRVRKVT